jgi:hypothetical protein
VAAEMVGAVVVALAKKVCDTLEMNLTKLQVNEMITFIHGVQQWSPERL